MGEIISSGLLDGGFCGSSVYPVAEVTTRIRTGRRVAERAETTFHLKTTKMTIGSTMKRQNPRTMTPTIIPATDAVKKQLAEMIPLHTHAGYSANFEMCWKLIKLCNK